MKIRTLLIAVIFILACSENVQEVQDSEIKSNSIQPFKNIAKEALEGLSRFTLRSLDNYTVQMQNIECTSCTQ